MKKCVSDERAARCAVAAWLRAKQRDYERDCIRSPRAHGNRVFFTVDDERFVAEMRHAEVGEE